jgi:hypothetical protein
LNEWDVFLCFLFFVRLDRFFLDHEVPDSSAKEAKDSLLRQIELFRSERSKPEHVALATDMIEASCNWHDAALPVASFPDPIPVQPNNTGAKFLRTTLAVPRKAKFLIIYSRSKAFARLHRTDTNCPWTKLDVKDCSELEHVSPNMYDARCKLCWPRQTTEEDSASSQSDD